MGTPICPRCHIIMFLLTEEILDSFENPSLERVYHTYRCSKCGYWERKFAYYQNKIKKRAKRMEIIMAKTIRMKKEQPNIFRFYEDEEELGFAMRVPDMEKAKDFHIGRIRSYLERKGYATRMTELLIDYAKKEGYHTVTFVASSGASIKIAQKLKFEQIGNWGTDPIFRLNLKSQGKHLT